MTALFDVMWFGEKQGLFVFFYSQTLHAFAAIVCSFTLFGITHHGLKRDHWHCKLSAVSKQFSSLSLPSPVPSPSALGPALLGGHVTVSSSLEPYAHLRILAFLPHLLTFAAIHSMCSCRHSWGWAFSGLIKAKRVFSVQGHWNNAAYQYVRAALSAGQFTGADRWWSQHTPPTNILSGCGFCLIGSFAAQIPTYLMLMMKSQESWGDSCKLNVYACRLHSYVDLTCIVFLFFWGSVNTHTAALSSFLIRAAHCEGRRKFQLKLK